MKLLFFKTYLKTIKNSLESKIFQDIWAEKDNQELNIVEEGNKSCGIHVSGILKWFDLIEANHATVKGTIADMKKSDWEEIDDPKVGCVIYWEAREGNGSVNEHLGFYIGDGKAISNSSIEKVPKEHSYNYNNSRKILNLYWHPKLDNKYYQ